MPLFEYQCQQCGEITEVLEFPGGTTDKVCGNCGSAKLEKQFSVTAALKGKLRDQMSCDSCESKHHCPSKPGCCGD